MAARPIALVTGATSGIGAEFAKQLAARGHDLVLVARDAARLSERSAELQAFGAASEILAADLATDEGIASVEARLRATDAPVELLVNNAGFGLPLAFERNPIEDELQHLRLHVEMPMRLAHAALQQMLERGSGAIVNVASVAGFTPRGTYGAVKAWSLSFSRWARLRYAPSGVRVMALAPGFVRTEFHERMGEAQVPVPRWLWLTAPFLVREALRDLDRGKAVSVPGARYKVAAFLARVAPDAAVARMARVGR